MDRKITDSQVLLELGFNRDQRGRHLEYKISEYVYIKLMFNRTPFILEIDGNRMPLGITTEKQFKSLVELLTLNYYHSKID